MKSPILFLFSWWIGGIATAADMVVQIEPRWHDQPLRLAEMTLKNAAGNQLSVTRLAGLLSAPKLQREDGAWISLPEWFGFLDVEKQRTSFTLSGVPDGRYTALRFDLGLDAATDKSDPAKRAAGHPLRPDVNGLHQSGKGGYVFLAIEGRWHQPDGKDSSYSFHLAGDACRKTIEVPAPLDLRGPLKLTLMLDVSQFFGAKHRIDPTAAEPGVVSIADNTAAAFSLLRVEPSTAAAQSPETTAATFPGGLTLQIPAHFPQPQWPADNPLTKYGVALGRRLFNDGRLSANNRVSCSTCHWEQLAFSDPPRFSTGTAGREGPRNSLPLMNLAWKPSFFWDGRAPSVREQVMHPIKDPLEMNETLDRVVAKLQRDRYYRTSFEKAFGTPGITEQRLGLALEQYLLTLVNGNSKLDHALRGKATLTAEEQRGFTLFFTENDPARGVRGAACFQCHSGTHFTNHAFMNNGLDADDAIKDTGREKVTGNRADRGKFMVPSLRNLTLTDPYMHDGRFETLEEVIDHYDHGVVPSTTLDPKLARHLPRKGLGLTPEEKTALVSFLETLTEENE
ncbi:MAG TPA: MbnP family protein [Verrucomicrobiales bacterium]|nr:MbnP family protein [Verrucomicrobiales bacterium]